MKSVPVTIATTILVVISMAVAGAPISETIQQPDIDTDTEVVTQDFETFYDEFDTPDGMLLSDEYNQTHGFSFTGHLDFPTSGAKAITCSSKGVCVTARSGSTVIQGIPAGEFRNKRVRITFDEPKRSVSIYVRESDTARDRLESGEEMTTRMKAFTGTSLFADQIDEDVESFEQDNGWHELRVGDPSSPAKIRFVTISGKISKNPIEDNFFILDDLTYDLEGGPRAPPAVGFGPTTFLHSPSSFSDLSSETVEMVVSASDERRLKNVTYDVKNDSSFETVDSGLLCGDGFRYFPCPSSDNVFRESIHLSLTAGKRYTLRVTACDFAGDCRSEAAIGVEIEERDTDTPDIRSPALVEVSQGVQSDMITVPDGTARTVNRGFSSPLIANKTTVVRVYLMAENGTIPEASGPIEMKIEKTDGSVGGFKSEPNAGPESITIPEDPETFTERERLLWKMRANRSRTLNYVIPSEELANGSAIELNVPGVTGTARIPLQSEVTLGIIPYNMSGPTMAPESKAEMRALYQYLRIAYPISDLLVKRGGRWESVTGAPGENPFVGKRIRATTNETEDLLPFMGLAELGASLERAGSSTPDHVVAVGFADGFNDTGGRAYRPGAHAVSMAIVPAPQEIGHTLGLKHASDAHNESEGGSTVEWPYPHGTMSQDPNDFRGAKGATFGVVPKRTSGSSGPDWELRLIDPCRTEDLSNRLPKCTLDDRNKTHDFMSYGSSPPYTSGILHKSDGFRWASDITYRRVYRELIDRREDFTTETSGASTAAAGEGGSMAGSESQVEGLVIAGELREHDGGELTLAPMRKPVSPSLVADADGSHTIRLEAANGTTLTERSIDPTPNGHFDKDRTFLVTVPYHADTDRLVVEGDDGPLIDRAASPNSPEVTITSPDGGEIVESGEHTITWEATDPDGDPLTFLVQYSPDGGEHWESVTVVSPEQPTQATLHVRGFTPGRKGLIRVTVSDGLNSAFDVSEEYFSLGTDADPAPNRPPAVAAPPPKTIEEGERVRLAASFSDPDFLDTHEVAIDWGGDTVTSGDVTEDEGSGTVSGSHVYGDDGGYTVTVNVTDDHGNVGTNRTTVTVENLDPSVSLDTSGAIGFDGGDAFLGRAGEPQQHEATATDPGSDDLTFGWPGGLTSTYFNDGSPPADANPSPDGTFPFGTTDIATVTFHEPGVHDLGVTVTDDDDARATDTATKVITGVGGEPRGVGFWRHQYSGKGTAHYSDANLSAFLAVTDFGSAVFHENVSADSFDAAHDVLQTSGPSMRDKAEAQTLAAWLNFASGRVGWTERIDTDGDGTGDRPFHGVITDVESILNEPNATRAELERAKDLAEAINGG